MNRRWDEARLPGDDPANPVGEAMMACVLADRLLRYRALGGGV